MNLSRRTELEVLRVADQLNKVAPDAMQIVIKCMKLLNRRNELEGEYDELNRGDADYGFFDDSYYELRGRVECGSLITDCCCISCIDRMEEAIMALEKHLNILKGEERE